jgi:hypothetical protein
MLAQTQHEIKFSESLPRIESAVMNASRAATMR